jgi:hypothetical protein
MSVGGERIFSRITGREWRQLAVWLTLDAAYVSALVGDLVQQIPNAVEVIAARRPIPTSVRRALNLGTTMSG